MLSEFDIFFKLTFIFVLSAQMQNSKMRSSKLIIESNAQKQMIRSSFGRKCHDLSYFELDFSFTLLEFITHSRSTSNFILENHQSNVILPYFQQIFDNNFFNITTCTPTCIIFQNMQTFLGIVFVNISCLALQINMF